MPGAFRKVTTGGAAGGATEVTLAAVLTELGQKTEPADQQHVIVDSSASVPVTGPLTDAQLRASAVPISGTVTGNPGTAFGKTITYVSIAQGAPGTTILAAASPGNRHKIIGATVIMDAAGTAKFTDGGADLTGAMAIAANGGFVWGTSVIPYQQSGVNSALNLVTTVGAAKGVIQILTEP